MTLVRTEGPDGVYWHADLNGQAHTFATKDRSLVLHVEGIATETHLGVKLVDDDGRTRAFSQRLRSHDLVCPACGSVRQPSIESHNTNPAGGGEG